MPNPYKDCRTQHCENHHQGWTIAGIIAAVIITCIPLYKCASTDLKFPERYLPQTNNPSYQTNEVNLLTDPRWPRQPGQQRQ